MFNTLYVAAKATKVVAAKKAKRFAREQDGVALTEYILMLGLLIGGVIAAVLLFGQNLSGVWNAWAVWLGGTEDATVPALVVPGAGGGEVVVDPDA